jgi:hypothetical protein
MKELKKSQYLTPDTLSNQVEIPDDFYTSTPSHLGNVIYVPGPSQTVAPYSIGHDIDVIKESIAKLDDRLARIELALTHVIPHVLDKMTTDK